MDSKTIRAAIHQAGGARAVADARGLRSEWGVMKWCRDGLPAEHVRPLAELTGWLTTPHMLNPDLYPGEWDGVPPAAKRRIRKAAAERAA